MGACHPGPAQTATPCSLPHWHPVISHRVASFPGAMQPQRGRLRHGAGVQGEACLTRGNEAVEVLQLCLFVPYRPESPVPSTAVTVVIGDRPTPSPRGLQHHTRRTCGSAALTSDVPLPLGTTEVSSLTPRLGMASPPGPAMVTSSEFPAEHFLPCSTGEHSSCPHGDSVSPSLAQTPDARVPGRSAIPRRLGPSQQQAPDGAPTFLGNLCGSSCDLSVAQLKACLCHTVCWLC